MPRKQPEKDLVISSHAATVPTRRKPTSTTRKERTASKVAAPVVLSAAAEAESVIIASSEPTYQEIAKLAYCRWLSRGCQGGSAEADWLEAEQELRARA